MAANDDRHVPWSRAGCAELELEQIVIPEEDSRLHARARVDFGQVRIGERYAAALAGRFLIRMHVPRALQQQISGNSLVGSVLGSARITADISERVGSREAASSSADVCLFVGFHEARRGSWMVDLRVVRGSRLLVPVRLDTAVVLGASVISLLHVEMSFDEEAAASFGPISLLSGSVSDLWRSVRDQVRIMLTERLEVLTLREAGRTSRQSWSEPRPFMGSEPFIERRNGPSICSVAC